MRDDKKQRLVDLYESKKGAKGCYMHMLSNYQSDILEMHSNGITTFIIHEFILDDLDYFFKEDKEEEAFIRAIRSFIRCRNPKEEPRKKRSLIKKDHKQVVTDRSDLLTGDDTSEEAKKLFEKQD